MPLHNNIGNIKIQGIETKKIYKDRIVKVSIQGNNYVDVISSEKRIGATIKKLDKNHYVVIETGEIREYNKENNTDSKQKDNLKKTFNRLRQLIRTNFTSNSTNQLFITLTYKDNMMDARQLYKDFEKFFKRLQYKFRGHKLDYIAVAEPQGRGAWHLHIMLKSDQPVLYIDNKVLSEIWGLGYTDTQRLKSDDVGSYYVAYFTDILQDNNTNTDKKRVKGSRLSMYPKGFKFYRTSRGIEKPVECYLDYSDIAAAGYKKVYETAFEVYIEDENGKIVLNSIQKETWKC